MRGARFPPPSAILRCATIKISPLAAISGVTLQIRVSLSLGFFWTVSDSVMESFLGVAGQESGPPSAHHSQKLPLFHPFAQSFAYAASARRPRHEVLPHAKAFGAVSMSSSSRIAESGRTSESGR